MAVDAGTQGRAHRHRAAPSPQLHPTKAAGQDPRLPLGSSDSGLVPLVGFFKVEGASLVTQVRNQEEHPR